MSRYRSYGKLDDPFVTEGDTFFLRMNARLRPNQLKPGEVALSKNGRMNVTGLGNLARDLTLYSDQSQQARMRFDCLTLFYQHLGLMM